jgi:hypothetical protein
MFARLAELYPQGVPEDELELAASASWARKSKHPRATCAR